MEHCQKLNLVLSRLFWLTVFQCALPLKCLFSRCAKHVWCVLTFPIVVLPKHTGPPHQHRPLTSPTTTGHWPQYVCSRDSCGSQNYSSGRSSFVSFPADEDDCAKDSFFKSSPSWWRYCGVVYSCVLNVIGTVGDQLSLMTASCH